MIKISHECPLQLLPWSKNINDYDFILPYFYMRYPEYKEHYLKCKYEDRYSILDNGLFEGETYSQEDYLKLINELKPDVFIIPDSWNDYIKTHEQAIEWSKISVRLRTNLMVVLQGTTFEEMKRLFKWCYELGYRHFAFNHSSTAYINFFPHQNPLISQMMGRIQVVEYFSNFINNYDAEFHLLGTSLPQEFLYLKHYPFIKSLDTSSPIICGALGIQYDNGNLFTKPKIKMEKIFEDDIMPKINIIQHNVDQFRKLLN